MKSVGRVMAPALANAAASVLAASSTKLCAIATFGIAPWPVSLTVSFSPGLAVIAVTLYFIASVPVIAITRGA